MTNFEKWQMELYDELMIAVDEYEVWHRFDSESTYEEIEEFIFRIIEDDLATQHQNRTSDHSRQVLADIAFDSGFLMLFMGQNELWEDFARGFSNKNFRYMEALARSVAFYEMVPSAIHVVYQKIDEQEN